MPRNCSAILAGAVLACTLAAPVPALAEEIDEMLARMMRMESAMQGEELEAALEKASHYPLGSEENPVRAASPVGQRAYLSHLRCPDWTRPAYTRSGNLGPGVYGNIVDAYRVTCMGQEPATVVMDMYHAGHVETRAVPGFAIEP
jgi:hypothetical protein